jgi:16S rRNA (guanine527-N7)-methyltransferase
VDTLAWIDECTQHLKIKLTDIQLHAFQIYEGELLAWNEHTNLTAICDSEGIRIKHFLDSLTCLLVMHGKPTGNLIDIGSGAGFPGIPLKIILPDMRLTLVDSVAKKTAFCQHMVEILGLKLVTVIKGRAEEIGQNPEHRQRYDWAVARAVAHFPILVEFLLPLVKLGGTALAQKGSSAPEELKSAAYAIHLLGGRNPQLTPITLPGISETRYLITIPKYYPTPSLYPRQVGIPEKRPLGEEKLK